jgi:hypothetical protein
MHGILGRFLTHLGICGDDLTAASIYLWRLDTVRRTEGIGAATEFAGRTPEQKHLIICLLGAETRAAAPSPTPAPVRGFVR